MKFQKEQSVTGCYHADEERKIKLDRVCKKLIERYVKVGLLADEKPDAKDKEGDIDDEVEVDDHHESELDNDSEINHKSVNGDRVLEYAKDVILVWGCCI